jgi:hypothetical protein
VITDLAATTLRSLPPPTDGVLYLIGDSTLTSKRGRKHPLGHFTRHGEHEPYMFGFELVGLIATGDTLPSLQVHARALAAVASVVCSRWPR